MKRPRLMANYDKVCGICGKEFYSKSFVIKYCSKECSKEAYRERHRIAQANYIKRQKRLTK